MKKERSQDNHIKSDVMESMPIKSPEPILIKWIGIRVVSWRGLNFQDAFVTAQPI